MMTMSATAERTLLIGLVSISDRASGGVYEDKGIPALNDWLAAAILSPFRVETRLIADEQPVIEQTLIELTDTLGCDLVLTTGGTGPSRRDVTPEAAMSVIERPHAGLMELARARCASKTARTYLSRGIAGTRGRTLIITLPGSPRGATENLEALLDILPHAIETLRGEVQDDGRPGAVGKTGKVVTHKD